jgi:uncharacterized protein YqeY
MTIAETVHKDMLQAMKDRAEVRLGTLRLIKTALKNREIEKRAPLDDAEAMATLNTMIKQRRDSIEQFTKGGLPPPPAGPPAPPAPPPAEIALIETYLPKPVGAAEIEAAVKAVIAEMGAPTMKEMGAVMKAVMARFAGARVDGKAVSEAVRKALG